MINIKQNIISLVDLILSIIGFSGIMITINVSLFLLNFDVFNYKTFCTVAISKSRLWLCEVKDTNEFKIIIISTVIMFWIIYIPILLKHLPRYKNEVN